MHLAKGGHPLHGLDDWLPFVGVLLFMAVVLTWILVKQFRK